MNHVLARSDRCPLNFNAPEQRDMSRKTFPLQRAGAHLAGLIALRTDVRMEAMGHVRRYISPTTIARQMFKLGAQATRTEVLARLQEEIEEFQK